MPTLRSSLPAAAVLVSLAAAGCTPDVRGLYEAERVEALTLATERPARWSPDMIVRIAGPDLEAAVGTAIKAAVADPAPLRLPLPLGMTAELKPRLTVDRAVLRGSDACPACVGFDAQLSGKAVWNVGPASGSFPFEVAADGVFAVEVSAEREVRARPRSIGSVRVKIADYGNLRTNPSGEIQDALRAMLSKEMPRIALVDLGDVPVPIRDLRLRTLGSAGDGGVSIELLTDVPGARPAVDGDPLPSGVRVAISESALTGLARRAAFEQGELAMSVAADPRSLSVEGTRFTMGLRLWRLVGRGWWRDYTVTGELAIVGGKLKLSPEGVTETGHSPGAGLVDPLAALFQGKVLEAISDAFARSLPASRAEDLGSVRLRAAAKQVTGRDGTLVVDGTIAVQSPHSRP